MNVSTNSNFSSTQTQPKQLESTVGLPQKSIQPVLSSYTPHDSIFIWGDDDFVSDGWPGAGTEADPYVIEGLEIESDGDCIVIYSTDAHFVIRNCLLYGPSPMSFTSGIRTDEVSNGAFINCTIYNTYYGIRVDDSFDLNIVNNTIYNNRGFGIYARDVIGCDISNNSVFNANYGITLGIFNHSIFLTTKYGIVPVGVYMDGHYKMGQFQTTNVMRLTEMES